MIMYRTSTYSPLVIDPVEVKKLTRFFVVLLNGDRISRSTGYYAFHESWDAAHAHLSTRAHAEVERAQRALDAALAHRTKVDALYLGRPNQ